MNLIEKFQQAEKKKKIAFIAMAVIALLIVSIAVTEYIENRPDKKIQRATDYAINGRYNAALSEVYELTGEEVYVLRAFCNLKIEANQNTDCHDLQKCIDKYDELQQYITDIKEYRIYLNNRLYAEAERIIELTEDLTFNESDAFGTYITEACSVLEIIQDFKDGEWFTVKEIRKKIADCKTALGNAEAKYLEITGVDLRTDDDSLYPYLISEIEETYTFVLDEMDETEIEYAETDSIKYTNAPEWFGGLKIYFDEDTASELIEEATIAEYRTYFAAVAQQQP